MVIRRRSAGVWFGFTMNDVILMKIISDVVDLILDLG